MTMTAKEAVLGAFDRLFERAATKLKISCDADDRDEAKKHFEERFESLLTALDQVSLQEIPDEVMHSLEGAIDGLQPRDVVGLLASIPLAQKGQELLRTIAYRAAEERMLAHLCAQADDRYGGN